VLLNKVSSQNARKIVLFSIFLLIFYSMSWAIVQANYYSIVGLMGIGLLLFLFNNIDKSIYLLFSGILLLDWLSEKWFLIPTQITWLPELLSIVVLLYILLSFVKYKKVPLKAPYLLVYLFVGFTLFGIIINNVDAPVAIAGVRNHLKFLPFFLLPYYYDFSDDFMEKFTKFILFFSFLQCPIAIMQRLLFESRSGDVVGGTLGANTSGVLSLFCSFVIVLWTAYCFKRQLRFSRYIIGLIILFIPMTINETKISLFLIPLVFFSIFFFIPEAKKKVRYLILLSLLFISVLGIYRTVYNYYYGKTTSTTIESFFTDPQRILNYIHYNKYIDSGQLNRIPQIIFSYQEISKNLEHFLFGVGPGNASDSLFSEADGQYYVRHKTLHIDNIFVANMLWEYGLLGILMYLGMCILIFHKVLSMRGFTGVNGVLVSAFLGMNIILLISAVYLNTTRVNIYVYLYWFLAGYLMNHYYFKANAP